MTCRYTSCSVAANGHLGDSERRSGNRPVESQIVPDKVDRIQHFEITAGDRKLVDRIGLFSILDQKTARAPAVRSRRMLGRKTDRIEYEHASWRGGDRFLERDASRFQKTIVG